MPRFATGLTVLLVAIILLGIEVLIVALIQRLMAQPLAFGHTGVLGLAVGTVLYAAAEGQRRS